MTDHNQLPSGTTGPLTTFHPFPKLPWELRHNIWELAVRPLDRPGAHIFCIEERKVEGFEEWKVEGFEAKEGDVVYGPITLEPGKFNLHITVPATTISSGPAGNPSTYMIDGGLWTACKESRAVMEKVFKHQMWDPKRRAWKPHYEASFRSNSVFLSRTQQGPFPVLEDPFEGLEDETHLMPASGFFLSTSSSSSSSSFTRATKAYQPSGQVTTSPHYFSVFPHWDLLILRPSSWDIEDMWILLKREFPFGSEKWGYFGFGGNHGIAFEYHPIWNEDSEAAGQTSGFVDIFNSMTSAIYELEDTRVDTIWVIDYRLTLKKDAPANEREPGNDQRVFYGGDGRRYVEMYSKYVEGGGDRLQWFYTEGVEGDHSSIGPDSCHFFIGQFESRFIDKLSEDMGEPWEGERWGPAFGLLACLR